VYERGAVCCAERAGHCSTQHPSAALTLLVLMILGGQSMGERFLERVNIAYSENNRQLKSVGISNMKASPSVNRTSKLSKRRPQGKEE